MSRTSLKSSFASLGPIVLFHYCLSYGQHNDEYQNEDPQCVLFGGNMVLDGRLKVCRMVHFTEGDMENGFVEECVENYWIKDVYGAQV